MSTGAADFSDDAGSGSTPLNGAVSIATVTAGNALAGDLLRDQAAEGMADHGRRLVSAAIASR